MNRMLRLLCLVLLLPALAFAAVPGTRVVCFGDGITAGSGVPDPASNAYPAVLQQLLGSDYEVRNYGQDGMCVLRDGGAQYSTMPVFAEARNWLPDVVVISLGTEDVRSHPGFQAARFAREYGSMLLWFSSLPSRPRVIALVPPPVNAGSGDSTNRLLLSHVIPGIQSSALELGCEILSLQSLFAGKTNEFTDGIRHSAGAARRIAERLAAALAFHGDPDFDVLKRSGISGDQSSYHGFACTEFRFEGREAKIVRPRRSAPGNPWIWRARFWGHEPQTEISLLERGFHVAYCDVSELFMNDEARTIWERFYEMLTGAGLAEKSAFIAFSRGGIYAYRWAVAHPDRVSCVYADAPVLDLKSWPGGKGKGHGNPEEWERFKKDFGLRSEQEALAFAGNPIDLTAAIAAGGYPMLHICGEADRTVPIDENTNPFEQKILAAGGKITVIRKPGVDHHPHSLVDPTPIVDFIVSATPAE